MDFMQRTLDLARRAKGFCNPNPAVGAVVVRDGRVIGEGFTQPRGQAHAEIMALRQAGADASGATLYVSLEPCSHHGATGPCVEAVLAAGIRAVHCAMVDPSPWVKGSGVRLLEQQGVTVAVGQEEAAARRLNEDYLHWVAHRRPLVTAKFAMSLDGKIATRTGSSRWISGPAARQQVGLLRSQSDAVLVGIGTVLSDDPSLTARTAEDRLYPRQPLRVVVDSSGKLPAEGKLASGKLPGRTLVATTPAGVARLKGLCASGIEVWVSTPDRDGRVDLCALLDELGKREAISVLVESGGTLLAALMRQRLVQRVKAFVAPLLIGGRDAPTPLEGEGIEVMAEAVRLQDISFERVGDDVLVQGSLSGC